MNIFVFVLIKYATSSSSWHFATYSTLHGLKTLRGKSIGFQILHHDIEPAQRFLREYLGPHKYLRPGILTLGT